VKVAKRWMGFAAGVWATLYTLEEPLLGSRRNRRIGIGSRSPTQPVQCEPWNHRVSPSLATRRRLDRGFDHDFLGRRVVGSSTD
jgi:hypothetical protein